ncbi:MAG TPA: MaoC family dehydratase N-terminal domain-containing protein [Longimicrobiaceae bacterium]|nr:MaoC family dehydratase N-terminal domain-containing protein [Longimicrobiaceae bacterium]
MWNDQVGARSDKVRNPVEEGAVRQFAEAIGDLNPLYLDETAARSSHWGRRIAPPTFPRTFDFGSVPGVRLPEAGTIHGEQAYRYERPLFVGEAVFCHSLLRDVYERAGKAGTMTFLVFERAGDDAEGTRVFTCEETYIITEAVRRSMEP